MKIISRLVERPRRNLVVLVLWTGACVLVGLLAASAWDALNEKRDLLDPDLSTHQQLVVIVEHYIDDPITSFSSCERKVSLLHSAIGAEVSQEERDQIEKLLPKILLDGTDCNDALKQYFDSRSPIPDLEFWPGFSQYGLSRDQLSEMVGDEGGLMLWLYLRINHNRLVPPQEVWTAFQETSAEEYRDLAIALIQ